MIMDATLWTQMVASENWLGYGGAMSENTLDISLQTGTLKHWSWAPRVRTCPNVSTRPFTRATILILLVTLFTNSNCPLELQYRNSFLWNRETNHKLDFMFYKDKLWALLCGLWKNCAFLNQSSKCFIFRGICSIIHFNVWYFDNIDETFLLICITF